MFRCSFPMGRIAALLILSFATGCMVDDGPLLPPKSVAESLSGYTYVPVDPIAVKSLSFGSGGDLDVRRYLPDNSVRSAVEDISGNGGLSFPAGKATAKGSRLRLTVDYIMADTMPVPMFIVEEVTIETSKLGDANQRRREIGRRFVAAQRIPSGPSSIDIDGLRKQLEEKYYTAAKERSEQLLTKYMAVEISTQINVYERSIPVYVGVGLRVTADVKTVSGSANISGLGAIGVEADAGKITGSLVVQTIGVNGTSVSAALPIQSELNRTTAMNAVVAVGAIKALLFEDETRIAPRVVGFYLPFAADRKMVNSIVSEIVADPLEWEPWGLRGMKAVDSPPNLEKK